MAKDQDMTDANKASGDAKQMAKGDNKEDGEKPVIVKAIPKPKPSPSETLAADIRRNIGIIEKAVVAKELRLLARVLRGIGNIRKHVITDVVEKAILCYVPDSYGSKTSILSCMQALPDKNGLASSAMEVDDDANDKDEKDSTMKDDDNEEEEKVKTVVAPSPNLDALSTPSYSSTPEVHAFLHLLVVIVCLDRSDVERSVTQSHELISYVSSFNRRTLDEIVAKSYFYYARGVELEGRFASIRNELLSAYRTASLHRDNSTQGVLLNLLLRNYISYSLYDQADKLLQRTVFPETRSNNQLARYLYYTGRIKAVQLDYNDSLWNLRQALRKAPQSTALGFRVSIQKFIIIVQLLIGEIPARDTFRQSSMRSTLSPYLQLTQAIRVGDMDKFKFVVDAFGDDFVKDSTMSLIARLRHNVIKVGLRRISCAYSRIHLKDVCERLQLDTVENTEGVVAKAVLDGVIDAVVDHEGAYVKSRETIDIYSSIEPTDKYHSRVEFCLNVYKEAIKAMRFPEKIEDDDLAEQRRERFKEQEELAKTLAEEEEDEFEQ